MKNVLLIISHLTSSTKYKVVPYSAGRDLIQGFWVPGSCMPNWYEEVAVEVGIIVSFRNVLNWLWSTDEWKVLLWIVRSKAIGTSEFDVPISSHRIETEKQQLTVLQRVLRFRLDLTKINKDFDRRPYTLDTDSIVAGICWLFGLFLDVSGGVLEVYFEWN